MRGNTTNVIKIPQFDSLMILLRSFLVSPLEDKSTEMTSEACEKPTALAENTKNSKGSGSSLKKSRKVLLWLLYTATPFGSLKSLK